jgi:hypothetical protein
MFFTVASMFGLWYHSNVRLSDDREGILVDTGAIDNIMSDTFYKRFTQKLKSWNIRFGPVRALPKQLNVDGVGKTANSCHTFAELPIQLEDNTQGMFQAPIIDESEIPALWGLRSLKEQRALIDTFNQRVFFIGKEGYQLSASPGTKSYRLESAKSGHLLLPVTEFKQGHVHSHVRGKHPSYMSLGSEAVGLPMTAVHTHVDSSL